ncbi:MAG: hypothetical protein IPK29_07950 [Betaproteobacteria bacterium]|nr:hypothetical protein [Betaproteobacteria bacterium]
MNAPLAWLMLGRAPGRAERTLPPPAYVVIILGALEPGRRAASFRPWRPFRSHSA